MKLIYETSVTSTGGRDGRVKSDDEILDLKISKPPALGGKEGYTNPEQLFAAGYAACFESALSFIAKKNSIKIENTEVTAIVGLYTSDNQEGFNLAVKLEISLGGVEENTARDLISQAHRLCPYSRAIRNNAEVTLHLKND